jgi:hypothetical protein
MTGSVTSYGLAVAVTFRVNGSRHDDLVLDPGSVSSTACGNVCV